MLEDGIILPILLNTIHSTYKYKPSTLYSVLNTRHQTLHASSILSKLIIMQAHDGKHIDTDIYMYNYTCMYN